MSKKTHKYYECGFWIHNILSLKKNIISKLSMSMCFIVLPSFIFFIPFIITRYNIFFDFSLRMWLGLIFGIIWLGIAPILIDKYYIGLINIFDEDVFKINCHEIQKIKLKYAKSFYKIDWFTICWCILVSSAIVFDNGYLYRFGTEGFNDPYFYIFILLVNYMLYYTALGFKGVFITFKIMYFSMRNNLLLVDFFHPDGIGGMNHIKKYVMFTTKLFATGTLFIPILLDYIVYTNSILVKAILYVIIMFYAIFIILSFLIPLNMIHKYTEKHKRVYLGKLTQKYKKIAQGCIEGHNTCCIENELEALNLFNYMSIIKETSMYSISFDTVVQILFAIAIPVLGLFISVKDIINVFSQLWV